jgi:DNA-binding NarL/FixJ family response regulator
VATAATVDEGLALARNLKPGMVTLDLLMPRKNGWDALRELEAAHRALMTMHLEKDLKSVRVLRDMRSGGLGGR